LSYWPARLLRLENSIPRNRFLGSINVYKYGLWIFVPARQPMYTDKKEKKIFLIYKEIQMGAVANNAKSYMRKSFLIYEEMR
jgi:hypothetical protein